MLINNDTKAFGGFTLIELLVVIVLIGISAAIILPIYDKAVDDAHKRQAFSQLNVIRSAERAYQIDHNHYHGFADLDNVTRNILGIDVSDTPEWDYLVTNNGGLGTAASATATAKRLRGKHTNDVIWMAISSTATAKYTW